MIDMEKITDLLKTRFSARKFSSMPIPQDVLDEILEAGPLSPSGGNQQPWHFGVITDPELIAQISQIAHHQSWMAQASLVVVLCTVFVGEEEGRRDIQIQRYPEQANTIASLDQDLYWAINQEEHQTKIAGTHMVLAAPEHGVGACWVSRFEVWALAARLNLPKNCLPAEILVFGYPECPQKPAPKKSPDKLIFFNRNNSN